MDIRINNNLSPNLILLPVPATDDFQVTKVTITITDADGVVIEQGEANDISPKPFHHWEYKASTTRSLKGMKIVAVAYDWPDNQGSAEIL